MTVDCRCLNENQVSENVHYRCIRKREQKNRVSETHGELSARLFLVLCALCSRACCKLRLEQAGKLHRAPHTDRGTRRHRARGSIGAVGRAKFESTELCSVYVDSHAILALAIGNGS